MKTLIVVVLMAALTASVAVAQTSSPVYVEQAAAGGEEGGDGEADPGISRMQAEELLRERLSPDDQERFDAYLFDAYPEQNYVLKDQRGDDNTAVVEQRGTANLSIIYQHGDLNATFVEQRGRDNLFGSYLTGDANYLDVVQRGHQNVFLLDFEGSGMNPEHQMIEQLGDGNQLVQVGAGSTLFGVQQRGDGMQMIIRHNR